MNNEPQDNQGTEQSAEAAPEPSAGQPEPTPGATPAGTMQGDPVMVFLAYFGIFALIPLLTVKDNDYVRWHAKQGLTYLVTAIVVFIALTIASAIFSFIPVVGGIITTLLGLLMLLLSLGFFVLWVLALVKAFGNERWKIPVVGDLSERW